MNRPLRIAVGLLCLFAPTPARPDSIDDFIKREMSKRDIATLSLAIIQDGKIVKSVGYGVADKTSRTPVTPETLFQAGSVSKSVAALGALRLVEQGKLSLDDDINQYLRTWKVPENRFTKEQKVTLRRILSHTAGLTVYGFPGYDVHGPIPTLVQVLNGKPANTPAIRVDILPGSQWRYSGGGYTVMQQVIIDVTGKPFPEYMQANVLQPLGMTNSTFRQPLPPDLAAKTASGYYQESRPVRGRWHIYPEMAAAGLWTTATDLAKFAIGVQQSLSGRSNPVISQAMTGKMLTVEKDGDGLGVFLAGRGRTLRFSHNGRDEGFDAVVEAYAETGQGAAIMINANEDSRMVGRILELIAREYHWPDYPVQPVYKPIPDNEAQLTSRLKKMLLDFTTGKFDRDNSTPELAGRIDAQLKQGLSKFLKRQGPLKDITLVERTEDHAVRRYRYRVTFAKATMLMPLSIVRDGKIAAMTLEPE